MKIVLNGTEFTVLNSPNFGGDPLSFFLDVSDDSEIPVNLEGSIVVKELIRWPKPSVYVTPLSDEEIAEGVTRSVEEQDSEPEDFVLYETTAEEWEYVYAKNSTIFLSHSPEPEEQEVPEYTEEELAAMQEQDAIQSLASAKGVKIKQSKVALANFLKNNPILWTDGEYYAVTEEKQSLLTSQLSLYSIAQQAGVPYELKWNSTGDVCKVWSIEDLTALTLTIGAYVQPLVSYQQTVEVAVKNCTSIEDVNSIVIDYSTVHGVVSNEEET